MRLAVDIERHALGADAVAALDLVGVRDALSREHAGVGAQAANLIFQPAAALRVELAGSGNSLTQGIGLRGELGRMDVPYDTPISDERRSGRLPVTTSSPV